MDGARRPELLVLGGGGWHWERLARAARELALPVRRLGFPALRFDATARYGLRLGEDEDLPGAVLVRFVPGGSFEQVTRRLGLLHALEALAVPVINPATAIERCVDKSQTSFRLRLAGLPTPPSWTVEREEDARAILEAEAAAGFELVFKPLFGAQGRGLERLRGPEDLPSAEEASGVWYLQRYVPPEGGDRDFRVFVIDGEPIAAMARRGSSWITNLRRGGRPEPIARAGALGELAVAAVRAVGAFYAGVDILEERGTGRLLVLEVNSQPAWQGLQAVTPFDIARELLAAIARRMRR
ncbi:MAG: RimK family alpha-L-glutamate ligase [Geminicoccaceae bacterium]|nr:RimK family alpha-L-glutamate ligase [Geminicoccaceae bacterium]MDW8444070.1 RimK family alpha-L-glutamate ligase [Acetobacteraceae bacterium]MCS7268147.1 RimK family alpha-L-glutamate ligase [Geminicoccaceae bacterium]MCX7629615.1 RimK family alpha-L-glutamate ligase [Geminicoccaceae bacterium]MDW8125388.1 RimK family alpha-L-glutamate ligase [Geminicoccaceae bacterium]